MANTFEHQFTVERQGVPFTVMSANEEDANAVLDEMLKNNPDALGEKAKALDLIVDEQTGQARERTVGDIAKEAMAAGNRYDWATGRVVELTFRHKFNIGMGRSAHEGVEWIKDVFSFDALSGLELRKRQNEDESFAVLDNLGEADRISLLSALPFGLDTLGPEDLGQLAGWIGMVIAIPGSGIKGATSLIRGLGKGIFGIAKVGTGLGLAGRVLRTFLKTAKDSKLNPKTFEQAAGTEVGRSAIKALSQTKDPVVTNNLMKTIAKEAEKHLTGRGSKVTTDKVTAAVAKAEAKQTARDAAAKEAAKFKPGSNKAVRDAQVRIAKEQRAQSPQVSISPKNVAAQTRTASSAASREASLRSVQETARRAASKASGQAGRTAAKEQKARVRKEIAELVRRQATGQ